MRASSLVSALIVAAFIPLSYWWGRMDANLHHAGDYQAGLHDGAGWLTEIAASENNKDAALLQHDGLKGYCEAVKGANK